MPFKIQIAELRALERKEITMLRIVMGNRANNYPIIVDENRRIKGIKNQSFDVVCFLSSLHFSSLLVTEDKRCSNVPTFLERRCQLLLNDPRKKKEEKKDSRSSRWKKTRDFAQLVNN